MRIGLVSDTHGLLDPKLAGAFRGVALVLHAGDVVKPAVLEGLAAIAPVHAVRGNNDEAPPLDRLPEIAIVPIGPLLALVVHDLGPRERPHPAVRRALAKADPHVVVHGHSHRPGVALVDGRVLVNPGSAGPRRFSLPRTAALLEIRRRRVRILFLDLAADPPAQWGEPFQAEP
jgi:putative phosphoesterase